MLFTTVVAKVRHVFGDLTSSELVDLLLGSGQSPLVTRRRALLIVSRVRMVALVFAMLTPLWIPVDLLVFEHDLGLSLAILRLLATLAFGLLAFAFRRSDSLPRAHLSLACLLAIPTVFFMVSSPLLARYPLGEAAQEAIAAGYSFLPFVMVAGLSVFPITALEGVVLSAPLWMVKLGIGFVGYELMPFASQLGALWLLGLLAVVATLAGMSQLHFMSQLVTQASHDGLTRAYTRRVGEELLDVQFNQAQRTGGPLALVFVDLDHFKQVNDRFGHEEGDATLRQAATVLRRALRRADLLIRWGGEEFLVVMPQTDLAGAQVAFGRLCDSGFGARPDGQAQTASIGIAELQADGATHWTDLVEKADHRMYHAKKNGRNRVVAGDLVPVPA
jgi:diguanylate cyclase (GGDEF)-like protein